MNAICCSENLDFRIVLPRPASLYITRKLALQAVQFSGFRSVGKGGLSPGRIRI